MGTPWYVRILDVVFFATLFAALSTLFPPKHQKKAFRMEYAAALLVGNGMLLFLEKISGSSLYLYILNFVVMGFAFSVLFLDGRPMDMLSVATFYSATFFLCTLVEMSANRLFFHFRYGKRGLAQLLMILLTVVISRSGIRPPKKGESLSSSLLLLAVSAGNLIVYFIVVHQVGMDVVVTFAMPLVASSMNIAIFFMSARLRSSHQMQLQARTELMRQKADAQQAEDYRRMYEELHAMRHEMLNHAQVLESLAQQKKFEELRSYTKQMHKSVSALTAPVDCGNPIVNAVLQQKLGQAAQLQIPVTVTAQLPSQVPVEDMELCSVLSNLINNAMESSRDTENPSIAIVVKPVKGYLFIRVSNRVEGDILAGNPELHTTKTDGIHGIGLGVVRRIVKKYNGLLDFKQEDDIFSAEALLMLAE